MSDNPPTTAEPTPQDDAERVRVIVWILTDPLFNPLPRFASNALQSFKGDQALQRRPVHPQPPQDQDQPLPIAAQHYHQLRLPNHRRQRYKQQHHLQSPNPFPSPPQDLLSIPRHPPHLSHQPRGRLCLLTCRLGSTKLFKGFSRLP